MVKTNLSCRNLVGIYRVIQESGPDVLKKKVLQGNEYSAGAAVSVMCRPRHGL